ncbi:hypothetical protein ISCGN_026214 [Ixodes scapularis]
MPDDARLKLSTRQAFGRKRKRPWDKKPKLSAASAPPRSAPPDALDLPETSAGDIATPCSSGSLSSFASADRVGTAYYSTAEQAQRVAQSDECKRALSEKSATQRKFDLLGVTTGGQTRDAGTQFIVVDMKAFNDLFAQAKCGSCGAGTLTLSKATDKEYGLAVKLLLVCATCEFEKKQFSSPRVAGTAKITPFEVNMRATKGIQSIGKGVTALADFCASMNWSHHGLYHKTFQGHLKTHVQACEKSASASEAASTEVVKRLYADFLNPVGNIDVIFDGSWMTRGRSSHIGVGCIVELCSGLVLDHVVYSNLCLGCALGPEPEEERYGDWYAAHECQRNIDCNSGRMEVEAALTMFQRSLAKHGLRYTTVRSDGDSRTFHALTEAKVYGFVEVEKKDCVNHVHKRMGAALRNPLEKKKAQGEALGGKGRLTQDRIEKIQNYYSYALRSNSNNVPGMKRAVEATLLHMTSTDSAPDHRKCPDGAESWCKFNRALANGVCPPARKNPLPDCVRAALEPVFARLSDENLLARCSEGKTQNASESLHSVIWTQTSKNANASLDSVKKAAAEAVAVYNQGRRAMSESVAASLGYAAGDCLVRRSMEKDNLHLRKANATHQSSSNAKQGSPGNTKPEQLGTTVLDSCEGAPLSSATRTNALFRAKQNLLSERATLGASSRCPL